MGCLSLTGVLSARRTLNSVWTQSVHQKIRKFFRGVFILRRRRLQAENIFAVGVLKGRRSQQHHQRIRISFTESAFTLAKYHVVAKEFDNARPDTLVENAGQGMTLQARIQHQAMKGRILPKRFQDLGQHAADESAVIPTLGQSTHLVEPLLLSRRLFMRIENRLLQILFGREMPEKNGFADAA